jgi:hypothetical protein
MGREARGERDVTGDVGVPGGSVAILRGTGLHNVATEAGPTLPPRFPIPILRDPFPRITKESHLSR